MFWPCPADDHPGTPRLFARPLRAPPTGAPASTPSSTGRRPRSRTSEYPLYPDHRARAGAVPVGHADAPRPVAAPRPSRSRSSRSTPQLAPSLGIARRRPGPADARGAGAAVFKARLSPRHPARHACSSRSTGAARGCANSLTQRGARPDVEDARVQGLCGPHREGRAPAAAASRDADIDLSE